MRRIALINQKGGVGKTTTTLNLGAALARAGQRVVVVDLDPQANLTLSLGIELAPGDPSTYRVLTGEVSFGTALRTTKTPGLSILPTDIDLSGAELELSTAERREGLLKASMADWMASDPEPADFVLFDCPPSLGLLSLNALTASDEVFLVVQTHFLALQGMSKLVEVIDLVRKNLHPGLELTGIVPCMYDSRMRLAREVLSELRRYFPREVFRASIASNVKLAESPSFGQTIFEYAPESIGARDFTLLAEEVLRPVAEATAETSARATAPAPTPPDLAVVEIPAKAPAAGNGATGQAGNVPEPPPVPDGAKAGPAPEAAAPAGKPPRARRGAS